MKKLLLLLLLLTLPLASAQAADKTPAPTPPPATTPQPAPPKSPETAKDFFELAVKRFQLGDLAGAERNARTAIALESRYAEAHYVLGRILLFRAAEKNRLLIESRGVAGSVVPLEEKWSAGQTELQEAVGQFRTALKLNPKSSDAWLLLATSLDNLGEKEEAESAYKQTINLDPIGSTARDAHNNLGLIYMAQKKYKEAKAEFDAALSIDPAFDPSRLNLDKLKQLKPKLFK